MARKPTAEIPLALLEDLFQEFSIWDKIRDGRLLSHIVAGKDLPSHHYSNSLSHIVKHRFPDGRHVATTHRIQDGDGNILHEDAKDIHYQEVCLWRL